MNSVRTFMLLAAMTALFMGVGYLIGGAAGMMIAFLFAAGTNLFAYWNSDKMAATGYPGGGSGVQARRMNQGMKVSDLEWDGEEYGINQGVQVCYDTSS